MSHPGAHYRLKKKKKNEIVYQSLQTWTSKTIVLQPNSQEISCSVIIISPSEDDHHFEEPLKTNRSFWFNPVSECAVPSTWKISFLVNFCLSLKVSLIQPSLTPAYRPFCSLSSASTATLLPLHPADHRSTDSFCFHYYTSTTCLPVLPLRPQIAPSIIIITPLKTPLSCLSAVFTPENPKPCQIQPYPFSISLNSLLWIHDFDP